MNRARASLLLFFTACVALAAYLWLHDTRKDRLEALLRRFDMTVAERNREQIVQFLRNDMLDDARITLAIDWEADGADYAKQRLRQEMSKRQFLHLLDLTLYTLEDYRLHSSVNSLTPGSTENISNANIQFSGTSGGKTYMLGIGFATQYRLNGACDLAVSFDKTHDTPSLGSGVCNLIIRAEISSGEMPAPRNFPGVVPLPPHLQKNNSSPSQ